MNKFFTPLFSTLLLVSCSPKLNYIGADYGSTKHIQVFVDEATIKKDYEITGVGTVEGTGAYNLIGKGHDEVIVRKAIKKAKVNGADAVLFQNYFIRPLAPETKQQSQTIFSDSSITRKSSQTVQLPPQSTGRQILFLKFK